MKPEACGVLETKEDSISRMKEWSTLSSAAEKGSFRDQTEI